MSVRTITPAEVEGLRRGGRKVELIDVRTPVEYRQVHASGARLVPLDVLDPRSVMAGLAEGGASDRPVYLICKSGGRSRQAAERFAQAGYPNALSVEGGTLAWEREGLPTVRGEAAISLERQVRIAAGSLVVLGTALGAFVHPAFLGLAGFVGAGLMFSGITDTCGMGLILARMPWNHTADLGACNIDGGTRS